MFKTSESRETLINRSGIYKITLRGTNRHYIGQSENLWKRLRSHINEAHSQSGRRKCKIQNAIAKHGSDAFDYSVLAFCDVGNLDQLETFFLLQFNGVSQGFNRAEDVVTPGRGLIPTQEHRNKISKANTGKKRSLETLKRMSEARRRRPPISEETRAKMRASQAGKTRSAAWKEKFRDRMVDFRTTDAWKEGMKRSGVSRRIPINQFDKSGNFIASFSSTLDAAKAVQGAASNVVTCAKDRIPTYKGFIWKYAPHYPN